MMELKGELERRVFQVHCDNLNKFGMRYVSCLDDLRVLRITGLRIGIFGEV